MIFTDMLSPATTLQLKTSLLSNYQKKTMHWYILQLPTQCNRNWITDCTRFNILMKQIAKIAGVIKTLGSRRKNDEDLDAEDVDDD